MTCRERLEQWLAAEGVTYDVTSHRTAYTAQDVASAEGLSGYAVAKVVMAAVDDHLVMLVLPAPYRVDLEKVRRDLHADAARLAEEREFANIFPDCDVGAMPPFGSLYGLPVYADESLTRRPRITFNAGSHHETMTIAYADFERLTRPQIVDFSTPPHGQALRPSA